MLLLLEGRASILFSLFIFPINFWISVSISLIIFFYSSVPFYSAISGNSISISTKFLFDFSLSHVSVISVLLSITLFPLLLASSPHSPTRLPFYLHFLYP